MNRPEKKAKKEPLSFLDQGAQKKLLASNNMQVWEEAYQKCVPFKYSKSRYSPKKVDASEDKKEIPAPRVYVIPRIRTQSYKIPLEGVDDPTTIVYCPISKGYGMQGLSTFSLGPSCDPKNPFLVLVNGAYSKVIAVEHLEGKGCFDLKRKNFWKRARKPLFTIEMEGFDKIRVNQKLFDLSSWLNDNRQLWYPEWSKWSKHVTFYGEGSFHWSKTPTVTYCNPYLQEDLQEDSKALQFIDFATWKQQYYIQPGLQLMESRWEWKYLVSLLKSGRVIALTHPEGHAFPPQQPLQLSLLQELIDSKEDFCTMPYVVAFKLSSLASRF
jgi:hypothetical protein